MDAGCHQEHATPVRKGCEQSDIAVIVDSAAIDEQGQTGYRADAWDHGSEPQQEGAPIERKPFTRDASNEVLPTPGSKLRHGPKTAVGRRLPAPPRLRLTATGSMRMRR